MLVSSVGRVAARVCATLGCARVPLAALALVVAGGPVAAQGAALSAHPVPFETLPGWHDTAPEAGLVLLRPRSRGDGSGVHLFDYRRGEFVIRDLAMMDVRAAHAFRGEPLPQILSGIGPDTPAWISPDGRFLVSLWARTRGSILRVFDLAAGGEEIAHSAERSRLPHALTFESWGEEGAVMILGEADGLTRLRLARDGAGWTLTAREVTHFPGSDLERLVGALSSEAQDDGHAISFISYIRDPMVPMSARWVTRPALLRPGAQQAFAFDVPAEAYLEDVTYLPRHGAMVMAGDGFLGVALLDTDHGTRDPMPTGERGGSWGGTDMSRPQLHHLPERDVVLLSSPERLVAFHTEALLDWLDDPLQELLDFGTVLLSSAEAGPALRGRHLLAGAPGAERLVVTPSTERRGTINDPIHEIEIAALLDGAGLGVAPMREPAPDALFRRLTLTPVASLPLPEGARADNHSISLDHRFHSFDILSPDGARIATRIVDAESLTWWDSASPLVAATSYLPTEGAFFVARAAEERRLFRRTAGVEVVLLDPETGAEGRRAFFDCPTIYDELDRAPYRCGDFAFPDHLAMRAFGGPIHTSVRWEGEPPRGAAEGTLIDHRTRGMFIHPRSLELVDQDTVNAPGADLPNIFSLVREEGETATPGGRVTLHVPNGDWPSLTVTLPSDAPERRYVVLGDRVATSRHYDGIVVLHQVLAGQGAAVIADLSRAAYWELRQEDGSAVRLRSVMGRVGHVLLAEGRGEVVVIDLDARAIRHRIPTELSQFGPQMGVIDGRFWVGSALLGGRQAQVVIDIETGRIDATGPQGIFPDRTGPRETAAGIIALPDIPGLGGLGASVGVIPPGAPFQGIEDARLEGIIGLDPLRNRVLRQVGGAVEVLEAGTEPLDPGMHSCGLWEVARAGQGFLGAPEGPFALRHGAGSGGAVLPVVMAVAPEFRFRDGVLTVESYDRIRPVRLRRISREGCP